MLDYRRSHVHSRQRQSKIAKLRRLRWEPVPYDGELRRLCQRIFDQVCLRHKRAFDLGHPISERAFTKMNCSYDKGYREHDSGTIAAHGRSARSIKYTMTGIEEHLISLSQWQIGPQISMPLLGLQRQTHCAGTDAEGMCSQNLRQSYNSL